MMLLVDFCENFLNVDEMKVLIFSPVLSSVKHEELGINKLYSVSFFKKESQLSVSYLSPHQLSPL